MVQVTARGRAGLGLGSGISKGPTVLYLDLVQSVAFLVWPTGSSLIGHVVRVRVWGS